MTVHLGYVIGAADELTLVGIEVRALQELGGRVTLFDAARAQIASDLKAAEVNYLFGDAAAAEVLMAVSAVVELPFSISLNPRSVSALITEPARLVRIAEAAQSVIVVTEHDRERLSAALPPEASSLETKIVHVPFGVTTPTDEEIVPIGRRQGIAGLGGFVGQEGRVLELQCLAGLLKAGVDATMDVLAPADEWGSVRELCGRHDMTHRVTLHSRPAEMVALLGQRRIGLVPGFPDGTAPSVGFLRPVGQALAVGTPLVAVGSAWVSDLVMHGAEGYVAPRHHADAEALAPAMRRLMRDDVLWNRFSEAGRRRAAQRFDLHRRAEVLMGLFGGRPHSDAGLR